MGEQAMFDTHDAWLDLVLGQQFGGQFVVVLVQDVFRCRTVFANVGHLRTCILYMGSFRYRTIEGTRRLKLTQMFSCSLGSHRQRRSGAVRSLGNEAYQLSIDFLCEGASAGFEKVGTQTNSSAMS